MKHTKKEKNVSEFAYGSEKLFIFNTEEQENTLYRIVGTDVPSFRVYCNLNIKDRQQGVTPPPLIERNCVERGDNAAGSLFSTEDPSHA